LKYRICLAEHTLGTYENFHHYCPTKWWLKSLNDLLLGIYVKFHHCCPENHEYMLRTSQMLGI